MISGITAQYCAPQYCNTFPLAHLGSGYLRKAIALGRQAGIPRGLNPEYSLTLDWGHWPRADLGSPHSLEAQPV